MSDLTIPYDADAERQVAGGAISNPVHGRGFDLVALADFYHPGHGRVFALREALADVPFVSDRIALAARRSGLDLVEAAALVSESVRLVDFSAFASRVAEVARARRLMAATGEAYNRLGRGEAVTEVLELLAGAA